MGYRTQNYLLTTIDLVAIMSIMNTRTIQVGTAEAKQHLSELVNQVSYGHRRVVITSRGRPKVAVVSLDDLERIGVPRSMLGPRIERRLKALNQADEVRLEINKSGKMNGHDPVKELRKLRLERDQHLASNLR